MLRNFLAPFALLATVVAVGVALERRTVVGIVALNYLKKAFGESMQKYETERPEFGRTVHQQGCMTDRIRRSKSIGLLDLSDGFALSTYVDACLATSSAGCRLL